jgi:hypothetical protein
LKNFISLVFYRVQLVHRPVPKIGAVACRRGCNPLTGARLQPPVTSAPLGRSRVNIGRNPNSSANPTRKAGFELAVEKASKATARMCKFAAKPRPEPDSANLEAESGADQLEHKEAAKNGGESSAPFNLRVFGDADRDEQNDPQGEQVERVEDGVEEPVPGKLTAGRQVNPLRRPAGNGILETKPSASAKHMVMIASRRSMSEGRLP